MTERMAEPTPPSSKLPPPRFVCLTEVWYRTTAGQYRAAHQAGPIRCLSCGRVFLDKHEILAKEIPVYARYRGGRPALGLLHVGCDTEWVRGVSWADIARLDEPGEEDD